MLDGLRCSAADAGDRLARKIAQLPAICYCFDAWLQRLLVNASYAEARRSRAWNANVRILPVDGPGGPDETISVDDRDRLDRALPSGPARATSDPRFHALPGPDHPRVSPTRSASRWLLRVPRLHYAHRAMRAAIEADERAVAVAGGRRR